MNAYYLPSSHVANLADRVKQQAKEYEVIPLLSLPLALPLGCGSDFERQVYNKARPHRQLRRRHTTSATGGVIAPSADGPISYLPTNPGPEPPIHAATEPAPHSHDDIQDAIELGSPASQEHPDAQRKGFLAGKIFKFRRRRHHPLTEAAYKKSIWGNLRAIIFSSWVNLLLVFVPVVPASPQSSDDQGIAVRAANVNATIIFSMNCVAVIPLAGVPSPSKVSQR